MKEVKDPIVDLLQAYAKFVDPISEKICFRPAQFMATFLETLNLDPTFILCLRRKEMEAVFENTGQEISCDYTTTCRRPLSLAMFMARIIDVWIRSSREDFT